MALFASRDQAEFHPQKYLLALAELIEREGGTIFERTRAVGRERRNARHGPHRDRS